MPCVTAFVMPGEKCALRQVFGRGLWVGLSLNYAQLCPSLRSFTVEAASCQACRETASAVACKPVGGFPGDLAWKAICQEAN